MARKQATFALWGIEAEQMRKGRQIEKRPNPMLRREEGFLQRKAVLLRFNLLNAKNVDLQNVYGQWRRVCEDPLVVKRSRVIEARRKPQYAVSVLCSIQHAPRVIAEMTSTERQELRERLGV